MIRRSFIISLGLALAVVVLFLAFPTSRGHALVNFKKALAEREWKTSGHADKTAEPFIHWNSAGAVQATCSKCHSTPGFQDFLNGITNKEEPIGTTVECDVCHTDKQNGILRQHFSVTFPSGVTINNLGPEAMCMECHQGRASKTAVDAKIAGSGVPNDDTSSTKLSFTDVHYYAAAATQFGTVVQSGYEYAGNEYDARFSHITGYNACITCHNPHSLEVNLKACNTCHVGVKDPKDIRYIGSQVDYNGNGNITEGIYYEVQGVMARELETIKNYARTVLGKPIAYNGATYPYWFFDTNDNGVADSDETTSYNAFSARLLKAAYNYQVAYKDPCSYVHNAKYIIELLYDSMADLNPKLAVPTDLSAMNRQDEGHFNGGSMPFRDWDSTGIVPATCSRCHSATGLAYYLENGTTIDQPSANGFLCTTCHTTPPELRQAPVVTFPSKLTASLGDNSNLCMVCHQGREAKSTVDTRINANPNGKFSFVNIHYFPAAAIFFGTEVKGGYEFPGKVYAGRQPFANHGVKFNTCVKCHMSAEVVSEEHNWTMRTHNVADPLKENCVPCHGQDVSQTFKGADPETFDFEQIRPGNIPDYNANGNVKESLKDEILGLESALAAQIYAYTSVPGPAAVYNGDVYPYWFKDLNGNGVADPSESFSSNGYSFDAKGLRAAYNFQVSHKEPHGFIHNARYIAQLLVDSIQHLGGDISKYTWR